MSKNKKPDQSEKVSQRDKIKETLNIKEFAWTEKQKTFFQLASNKESRIIFVNGPAGSAKTLLATYSSLKMLNEKRVSDIMYLRAAVESSSAKLGYLPGSAEEKIYYYGLPLLEKLDELLPKAQVDKLINEKRVDVFPVGFTRGLNWNAKAVIIDEAQNLTAKELITLLTRLGKFTKCFVLADPMQSDINGNSGAFENMVKHFNDAASEGHGIHYFGLTKEDIMRSELVKFLVGRFELMKSSH